MTKGFLTALLSTLSVALAVAAPAAADTTIGKTGGDSKCLPGFVAAAPNYVVPAGGGVITSFSYGNDGANAGSQLDFEVLRPNSDGSYTILAHTGLETLTATNGVETFPAHIPVSGGEIIGYYETGTDNCLKLGNLNNVVAEHFGSDPSPGQTLAASSVSSLRYSLNESATVGPGAAALSVVASTLTGTEGTHFTGQVASFSDPDGQPVGAYSATVTWGDGSTSAGTITQTSDGQYAVAGSHTYAEEGTYAVAVQIADSDGTGATADSGATVADAPISATGTGSAGSPVATQPAFSGVLASVSDQNPSGSASDLTATISWGDGTTSTGTVAGSAGAYTVSASHTYAVDGAYTVTTHVADAGGSASDATSQLLVYETASPSGGTFVIGDGVAGPQVFFWGERWDRHNPMSGGRSPHDFMGFAAIGGQSCGATFTGRVGAAFDWRRSQDGRFAGASGRRSVDLAPPTSAPAYMAVAVTGRLSRSGRWFSGVVERIVVVRTAPGYRPRPDSPGTGQVVATICG